MVIMFLSTTDAVQFFIDNRNFAFYIIYPVFLIGSIRALLVLLIEMDRTFATYFHIIFFNYRKFIPTFFIIVILVLYTLIDAYVLFFFCGDRVDVPPGCINILCALSMCYRSYWLGFEQIVYSLIIILSLLLTLKLFIKIKVKKENINYDLKRANRLALIDTFIIVVFDLIPPIIISHVPNFYRYLGPVNAFFKTMGFVVEGYLVSMNLKKRLYNSKTNVIVKSERIYTTCSK
ncbi:hypothetical protein GCK72_020029 [Caenorhabditis remanei]|uniref:Serpentine receptor class gamma n=1 Tax=Caenorhabditis remanei TaxID=31234 RepID=A0A6A5GG59_CAERE|nr:hypothetical protein GCK72_020029 [Caenorhabditis remanei]KAF1753472.1 hypothetical protein GCK72_020029 [Caenorhabditis remanei]